MLTPEKRFASRNVVAVVLLTTGPRRPPFTRKLMRSLCVVVFGVLSLASSAHADGIDAPRALFATPTSRDPWRIDWLVLGDAHIPRQRTLNLSATLVQQPANQAPQPSNQPVHAVAIQHSDAYLTRAKIHKYRERCHAATLRRGTGAGSVSLQRVDASRIETRGSCRRWWRNHRVVRGEHRHRRLEHVWRGLAGERRTHASTRARPADDGCRRWLCRHVGDRTPQRKTPDRTEFRKSKNDAPKRGDRLDQRRICRIPTHAAGEPLT